LDTEYFTPEYFIEQMRLGGNSPLGWLSNATMFRRSAGVIFQLSRVGEALTLAFNDLEPPPPPGEIRTRILKGAELSASIDMGLWSVSIFLLAIGLENLLKARVAQSGISLVTEDGALDKQRFGSHNLKYLARLAKLNLPKEDMKIVDWLTAFLLWRGRYPIPTGHEQLEKLHNMQPGTLGELWEKSFTVYDRIASLDTIGNSVYSVYAEL